MGRVGSQLCFVDILTARGPIRFIAAYAPHAGYARKTLEQSYDMLHGCMEQTRRLHFSLVAGGDFNT